MKVLFYSAHPHLSLKSDTGYGSHMRGIIHGFKSIGYEVETLVIGDVQTASTGATVGQSRKNTIKSLTPKIIWRSLKELALIKKDQFSKKLLAEKIASFQPDIVYERAAWMSDGSVDVLSNYRIKHIVEINAPFEEEVESFEQAKSFLRLKGSKKLKRLLSSANVVAPVTTSLASYLEKQYKLSSNQFLVVPNAIDEKEMERDFSKSAQLKNKLGLENKIVVGFVGSIFPYHGVDRLIEAIHIQQNDQIHLLVVGDGMIIPSLKKQAEDLGIANQITFTGSIPKSEVYDYIHLMDIVTLPNTAWYCSPVKIFEYGAMGKIILAVDAPGVRDVMSEEDGALFTNSTESLCQALSQVVENLDDMKKKAVSFRIKILENHTWTTNAQHLIQRLSELDHQK